MTPSIFDAEQALGRELEVYARYDVVLNGFAAKMSAQEAAMLRQVPGVREVYPDQVWQPDTDTSPAFLGFDKIWDSTNVPGDDAPKGEGILVGILDTGINMDHPSLLRSVLLMVMNMSILSVLVFTRLMRKQSNRVCL